MTGRYIALEGWEATGKSTQAAMLAERLDAVLTREPGGTALGGVIRQVLLGGDVVPAPRAEALLFAADRAQHIDEVVRPALAAGRDVVTDRSYGSTLAYQGHGRGQDLGELRDLIDFASDGILPDVVVLIEVPLEVARVRLGPDRDRLEAEDVAFQRRVVEGFSELCAADPQRWRRVEGTGAPDEVHARIVAAVADVP